MLTKEGEKQFLEMFKVSSDSLVSKGQLKAAVVQMDYHIAMLQKNKEFLERMVSELTFNLFCENSHHPFFADFKAEDLNKYRTFKFGGKLKEHE